MDIETPEHAAIRRSVEGWMFAALVNWDKRGGHTARLTHAEDTIVIEPRHLPGIRAVVTVRIEVAAG